MLVSYRESFEIENKIGPAMNIFLVFPMSYIKLIDFYDIELQVSK